MRKLFFGGSNKYLASKIEPEHWCLTLTHLIQKVYKNPLHMLIGWNVKIYRISPNTMKFNNYHHATNLERAHEKLSCKVLPRNPDKGGPGLHKGPQCWTIYCERVGMQVKHQNFEDGGWICHYFLPPANRFDINKSIKTTKIGDA